MHDAIVCQQIMITMNYDNCKLQYDTKLQQINVKVMLKVSHF